MATIAPFRGIRAPGALPAVGLTAAQVRDGLAGGRLVRDRPSLYRYEIVHGEDHALAVGLLARMAVDSEASQPPTPARDLDREPVVLRYEDERGWVDEVLSSNAFEEVLRVTDTHGEHRLWRVDRGEGVQEVVAQFEDRRLRVEAGEGLLAAARGQAGSGRPQDASVLVLLTPEGPPPAPWQPVVLSLLDEPRPRPWQELAGDPGKAAWRTPPLG